MRVYAFATAIILGLAGSALAEQRMVQATDGIINLRADAGWWADVVGLARNGSKVEILARSGAWVWVQHQGGAVGWMKSSDLARPVVRKAPRTRTKPTARPAAVGAKKYLSVVYTDDGALNLRSGPGLAYAALTSMSRGSWVEVQEKSGDWVKLRHESGFEGWAYQKYLTR